MQLLNLLAALLSAGACCARQIEPYPKADYSAFPTYQRGDKIPLECTKRQIDTGEHFFDDQGNVIFHNFPPCKETNRPLTLTWGVDGQIKCTVSFVDNLYHLFQLYLHQDVPFTCRVPVRPESAAFVPLDIQVRGDVFESHFDLDPNLSLLMFTDPGAGTLVSATSFSSSVNTTKVIIGQEVTMTFDVRWQELGKAVPVPQQEVEAENAAIQHYKLPVSAWWNGHAFIALVGALVGSVFTLLWSSRRRTKLQLISSAASDKLE